jgi:Holliday junction resolvase RusA-like endonuclease
MKQSTLKESLIRRLAVNYISYLGQAEISSEWSEGYWRAKRDVENFLKQIEVFSED